MGEESRAGDDFEALRKILEGLLGAGFADSAAGQNPAELMNKLRQAMGGGRGAGSMGFEGSQFAVFGDSFFAAASPDGRLSLNRELVMNVAVKTARGELALPGSNEGFSGVAGSGTGSAGVKTRPAASSEEEDAQADESLRQAFILAELWLSEATDFPAGGLVPQIFSPVALAMRSVDAWVRLATPMAEAMVATMQHGIEGMIFDGETGGQAASAVEFMKVFAMNVFSTQIGLIAGHFAGHAIGAGELNLPIVDGSAGQSGAVVRSNLIDFTKDLEDVRADAAVYLAARELAHARLYRNAPWIDDSVQQIVADFAAGLELDEQTLEGVGQVLAEDEGHDLRELLASGRLTPPLSDSQKRAHERLEKLLALTGAWVDVVSRQACKRLPHIDAVAEMVRRRRAEGGPAERAFSSLVNLELRPRRLREAEAMWLFIGEKLGVAARDALWEHPDLLPASAEIDNPELLLQRLTGSAAGTGEFDLELRKLIEGAVSGVDDGSASDDAAATGDDAADDREHGSSS